MRLFTFQKLERAQRFYEAHGFKVIKRGFEKDWQLEDLEYEWVRGRVGRGERAAEVW